MESITLHAGSDNESSGSNETGEGSVNNVLCQLQQQQQQFQQLMASMVNMQQDLMLLRNNR